MNFSLAAMVKRAKKTRRPQIVLRPITPTATMAGDLYAAAYKPIVTAWQQAVEQIAATYERALPVKVGDTHLITDAVFDLDSILSAIDGQMTRLVLAITPALRTWALRAEGWHRGKWRGAVLTATGIDLDTLLGASDVTDTVDAFVSRNVSLVRNVSEQTRLRIAEIAFAGYQARRPARDVAKDMSEAVGLGRKRSLRIAADQNSKLAARLDQARQEQAGIDAFKWRHSHKMHPRSYHVAHDGKIYPWSDPPTYHGQPDTPGMLPFCGCRAQAVLSLDQPSS